MNPYERFLEGRDPFKLISATSARLRSLVKGLTPAQLKKNAVPGKWSIHEIIVHLADCELMFCSRCRLTAFEDHPFLQPFDQDRWMAGAAAERESTADALDRFDALRKSQIRLYKASSAETFARSGNHPERGEVTMKTTFETCAGHDQNHLGQIENLRGLLLAKSAKKAPKKTNKGPAKKAKRKK